MDFPLWFAIPLLPVMLAVQLVIWIKGRVVGPHRTFWGEDPVIQRKRKKS